jgi:hypothetical protein
MNRDKKIEDQRVFGFGIYGEHNFLFVSIKVQTGQFSTFTPHLIAQFVQFGQFDYKIDFYRVLVAQEAFVWRMHVCSIAS